MHYSCWLFSLFVNNCSSTAKCVCASTIQPWNRLAFSPCKLETQGIVNSSALRCMCTVHFSSVIVIQACCFMSDYILISNAAEYAFMTLGCMYGGMSFKKKCTFWSCDTSRWSIGKGIEMEGTCQTWNEETSSIQTWKNPRRDRFVRFDNSESQPPVDWKLNIEDFTGVLSRNLQDSSTLFHASIFNLGLWLNISGQDAGKFSILLNFLIPNLTAVRLENPKSDRCQSWANMHPTCCLEFWRVYTHTHLYIYIHTYTCVCVCVCGMCVHIPEVGSLHHLRSPELDAVP